MTDAHCPQPDPPLNCTEPHLVFKLRSFYVRPKQTFIIQQNSVRLLAFFGCTFGGSRATLMASPNAPGNELLLRMTKLPGGLFFRKLIAE